MLYQVDSAARAAEFPSLLQQIPKTIVAVLDPQLRVVMAVGGALDDSAPGFLVGSALADVVPAERLSDAVRASRQALAGMSASFEYRDTAAGRTWSVDVGPYRDQAGGAEAVVWVARDVSVDRRAREELPREALRDSLTGVANRQLFMDRLQHALARLEHARSTLAVIFVDLDRLKSVNDSLGHAAGDKVLIQAAGRIRRALRPTDTVARFGGDEFVVLCESIGSETDAQRVGRRIAALLARPVFIDGAEFRVSASIGVRTTSDPRMDAAALVSDADAAMYSAKKHGRARLEVFDQTMRIPTAARIDVETGLRRALVENELRVVYQPQVRMGDYAVVGAEALLRWARPDGRLVDPGEFLAIAEDAGMMGAIGDWVVQQVCRDAASWPAGMIASVNLSAHEVTDPRLPERMLAFVEAAGAEPGRMRFEIAEASLFTDTDRGAAAMAALRKHGFGVALDDFGVGFSSLHHLRHIPDIDVLKLDRAFVAGLTENPRDAAIVASVILLTNSLRMETLGEGVETEEQADHLRIMGCDYGQGYWFGRPMPAGALIERMV